MARNLRALVTKNSMKERFRTAQTYLQKMKFLVEDVSESFEKKRTLSSRAFNLAYARYGTECGLMRNEFAVGEKPP